VKVKFKNKDLQLLYTTPLSELKGKQSYSGNVIKQYKKKIAILLDIDNIADLRNFKSLAFEALRGNRKGEYSIRLNDQYRLIFEEIEQKDGKMFLNLIIINEI